jgi:hypothetical protein
MQRVLCAERVCRVADGKDGEDVRVRRHVRFDVRIRSGGFLLLIRFWGEDGRFFDGDALRLLSCSLASEWEEAEEEESRTSEWDHFLILFGELVGEQTGGGDVRFSLRVIGLYVIIVIG